MSHTYYAYVGVAAASADLNVSVGIQHSQRSAGVVESLYPWQRSLWHVEEKGILIKYLDLSPLDPNSQSIKHTTPCAVRC